MARKKRKPSRRPVNPRARKQPQLSPPQSDQRSENEPVTAENVYIDPDVAYLLGMLVVRGTIHPEGDVTRIIIEFPFRNLNAQGLEGSDLRFDQDTVIRLSLDNVRRRLTQLLGVSVDIDRRESEVQLKAVFTRNTLALRNLRRLLNNKSSYHEFEIHPAILRAPMDIQKEFMRGVADTCSSPSPADNYMNTTHRIVLQIQFGNWVLPTQICHLLQTQLDVPVHNILWGHPNLRAPAGGHGWAKETRIRIFAQEFLKIGFNFDHKQQILDQLAQWNNTHSTSKAKFCNPKAKKIRVAQKKPRHADERDSKLPAELLGHHFDGYFQICRCLGCVQGTPPSQVDLFDHDEPEE